MCIYIDDGDSETLRSGTRRARKPQRCRGCRRTIDPGETYLYWVTLYDGNFSDDKMCAHCDATLIAGCKMTGCPRNWYWDSIYDLHDDEGAFVGDIVTNHDLTRRQTALMRLIAHHGRNHWRRPDGTLYEIPQPVEPFPTKAAA